MKPELSALIAAVQSGKRVPPALLEAALGYLDGPAPVWTLFLEPNPKEFHASLLPEDAVSPERWEELEAGAKPTEAELGMWRAARLAGARSLQGDGFHMVSGWRLRLPEGGSVLLGAFHEDQGTIIEVVGPVTSETELRTMLTGRGNLEE